ncbi:MAG: DNA polymerase III, subunit gamma and tau [Chloroflexi bacterium GWB2_49_20]|nr:MAG: DNA polymerase III, subunit gamma and tau [Chloroflexi bacterium GWB2_49_20]OGN77257.1 MAG: DNA polymerase III, subunit gamma and tau [Chloroflexi bacterium GWC2_49_37]OGN84746.1 MAG: DNA polymerase III, subunit gamma and tau [Chloroflexi bacterium GWD2_49_16]HCC78442.1 DNA polymerase III subunit gamma/tau [Anaerolineae bacterium]HCM96676.1 DNA polymerase III subunit gamma/tau [Anaerolineae bacterium]
MTQALYRKWRPQKWDEVAGQDHVTKTLRNAVAGGRIGHAYLFSGPRGTGKTSVARLLAKAANCLHETPAERPCNQCQYCLAVNKGSFLDLIEIDAASNNGVDDVRDLRDKINFSPNQGKYKIYIIDEVHMLSTQAFNALLKTLEEPPPHAIFILATTEINKIPATVLSRCQRHEFKRASVEAITLQLKEIANSEKIPADDEALTLIARQATGSFRDAISLLDQMASTGEKITLKNIHEILGTAASQNVLELVDSIQKSQPAEGLDHLHEALDAGTDSRVLARQIVEYLRALLLIKLGNPDQANLPRETLKQAAKHAGAFSARHILHMIREFNAAATDLRGGWQPALSLELALAGVMELPEEKQPVVLLQTSSTRATTRPTSQATTMPTSQTETMPTSQATNTPTSQATNPPTSQATNTPTSQAQDSPKPVHPPKEKPTLTAPKETDSDFTRLAKEWKKIKLAVKIVNRPLEAALNSCRPKELKNGILTLGCDNEFAMNLASKNDNVEVVTKAILDTLDMDLQIKCVISNARQDTPADIKQDGMVAEALKVGGKITDIQD